MKNSCIFRLILPLMILLLLMACFSVAFAENEIAVDQTKLTLNEGESYSLSVTLSGKAAGMTPVFTSTEPKIATVDEKGVVTAVSKGEATVTIRVKTESETFRASVRVVAVRPANEINVNENNMVLFPANDPFLYDMRDLLIPEVPASETADAPLGFVEEEAVPGNENVLIIRKGQHLEISATVLPKDASSRQFVLTSDNEDILRCQGIEAIGRNSGKCTLTISSKITPEVSKSYTVLVVKPAENVKIVSDTKTMFAGGTLQLSAIVSPDDASLKGVTWSVTEGNAATVDENGLVTGVSKGDVTIRARAVDGSKRSATIQLKVTQRPENITITDNSNRELGDQGIVVNIGSYRTVKAVVTPSTSYNKKVTWSSSDETIAKVNSEGKITPVSTGDVEITATSVVDPTVSSTVTAHVHQLVTKITFFEKNLNIEVDTTGMSYYTIEPANATDKSLIFSTSNKNIATVDQDGTVHGIKRGEVTITAKAADSEKVRASYKVNVLQPVHGVSMKDSTIRVGMEETASNKAILDPTDASNTRMTWTSEDQSIATVSGKNTVAKVYGVRWGTTFINGVTEDGGYTTSFQVNVGDLNKALAISDLYIKDGKIRIVVVNKSNMNIARFSFTLTLFDDLGNPLPCNARGENVINGKYRLPLNAEGGTTMHNNFYFDCGSEPAGIGKVVMCITGYCTDDGYERNISSSRQPTSEFCTSSYNPQIPTELPAETPEVQQPTA